MFQALESASHEMVHSKYMEGPLSPILGFSILHSASFVVTEQCQIIGSKHNRTQITVKLLPIMYLNLSSMSSIDCYMQEYKNHYLTQLGIGCL